MTSDSSAALNVSPELLGQVAPEPLRVPLARLRPGSTGAPARAEVRADGSVSLYGVPALDGAVLSTLVRAHGRAAAEGRRLRVVGANEQIRSRLDALGLEWLGRAA